MKKILKSFKKYKEANNFIVLNSLPYADEAIKKQKKEEILSVKEFSHFSPKEDLKKQYFSTVKSMKRKLKKEGEISSKLQTNWRGEKREEISYQIGNHIFIS